MVPQELRRKCRGCKSGVKFREKRRKHTPEVPAIIMGNVRSLGNKTDRLAALVKTQEYRGRSIFCFSETGKRRVVKLCYRLVKGGAIMFLHVNL